MFVAIENFKSAIAVENILTPYKKGRLADDKKSRLPKEKITPEVCFEVLEATNYARNIKDMLLCIAELSQSEQAQFKDVIFSTFFKREQPQDILLLAKKMAVSGGYENRFNWISKAKDGEILLSDAKKSYGYLTAQRDLRYINIGNYEKLICLSETSVELSPLYEKEPERKLSPVLDIPYAQQVVLMDGNFEKVKKINLKKGATVWLKGAKNLSSDLDFTQCDNIQIDDVNVFTGWKYRPETVIYDASHTHLAGDIDLSLFDRVDFKWANFSEVRSVKFKDGAKVNFENARNLSFNIDFSNCSEVNLSECDLLDLKELHFRDGAKVNLTNARSLPDDLDFSLCSEIHLMGMDLSNQQQLRFKNGAKVDLTSAYHLPDDLDFSLCDEVDLSFCDLKNQHNLRFKEGAKVCLRGVTNLPDNLDVSMCSAVTLSECDLKNQPNLCFRDGAKVVLNNAFNLPSQLDFSRCAEVHLFECDLKNQPNLCISDGAKVNLSHVYNLPPQLDFSRCSKVLLSWCDLKNQSSLYFRGDAEVDLSNAQNLPKYLDFSGCKSVNLLNVNFKNQTKVCLKDVYEVNLSAAQNLPRDLDISSCDEVNLAECDLSCLNCLKFKSGARVDLRNCMVTLPFVDFSPCSFVQLGGTKKVDFHKVLFRDYAQVHLNEQTWNDTAEVFYLCDMDDMEGKKLQQYLHENYAREVAKQSSRLWGRLFSRRGR